MTEAEIRPFLFNRDEHLSPVRVVMRGGEPWFVATDVTRILGFRDAEHAVRRLDDDETAVETLGGTPNRGTLQEYTVVSESGLYALIFRSRKPAARQFRKWVTSEVLPAIRKTGGWAPARDRDRDRITALLHQHQLRVYEAANRFRGGSASIGEVAELAGLSVEAVYRHVALLALLGLLNIIPDEQLAALMGLEPPPRGRLQ